MSKAYISVIAAVLFLSCGVSCVFCEETQASYTRAEESIYSYSENDIPEAFFFPKEKARWDGAKVTMREWYMLTDPQKERFISEYFAEMNKEYQGAIEMLGLDYLKALNLFSYYSNELAQSQPSTKVIDLLMEGQGVKK
ncbi:MAG: hypothetical protein Q7S07_03255 [Candidatus Omnitrophota bacterium]|nr:hypothetical protein [Candidatus Omnitrophota bacterium]